MQLTPHFSQEELTFSSTAVRLGIDNTAPPGVVASMTTAALGMEFVRALLGDLPIHVDSGYRCEKLERVLCQKDFASWCMRRGMPADDLSWPGYFVTKAHPQGYAVDFKCPAYGTPLQIVRAIVASGIKFDQCIMEGDWVHISFAPAMRQQAMTATFTAQGATYSQGVA